MINATRSLKPFALTQTLGGTLGERLRSTKTTSTKPPCARRACRLVSGRSGVRVPSSALKKPLLDVGLRSAGLRGMLLNIGLSRFEDSGGWSRTLGETLGGTRPSHLGPSPSDERLRTDRHGSAPPSDRSSGLEEAREDFADSVGRLLLEEVTAVREGRDFRVRDVCPYSGHGLRYVRKQPITPPVDEANWAADR